MKQIKTKTIILALMMLTSIAGAYAQVTIGDDATPRKGTVLDLKKTNSEGYLGGLLLPNVEILDLEFIPATFTDASLMTGYNSTTGVDTNPDLAGTLVYNTWVDNAKNVMVGMYLWDGEKWMPVGYNNCPAPILLTPTTDQTLSVGVGTLVEMPVTLQKQDNTILEIQWFMDGTAMNTNTYPTASTANLEWTPDAVGTYEFYCVVNNICSAGTSSQVTSVTYTVEVIPDPTTLPAGTGTLTGKVCFDIVYSNNAVNDCAPLASRASEKTDFSLTAEQDPTAETVTAPYTGAQVYTFTVSGSGISNLRFIAVDPANDIVESITPKEDYSGSLTNGKVCKATVVYKPSLNISLRGLTKENAKKMNLYAVYRLSGTDRAVQLTIRLQDCACCGAMTTSGEWLPFMCYNLGADETLDPFVWNSIADNRGDDIKGDLYQWGRPADDGHQKRNSGTTSTLATSDTPGHSNFITTTGTSPYDWRNPANISLWGDGTQDENQWASIYSTMSTPNTWSWTDKGYKVGQSLFLPAAGCRGYSNASLSLVGYNGYYWSSTVNSTNSYIFYFNRGLADPSDGSYRGYGFSVRCVQE